MMTRDMTMFSKHPNFVGWTDEYPSCSSEMFAISLLGVINHSLPERKPTAS